MFWVSFFQSRIQGYAKWQLTEHQWCAKESGYRWPLKQYFQNDLPKFQWNASETTRRIGQTLDRYFWFNSTVIPMQKRNLNFRKRVVCQKVFKYEIIIPVWYQSSISQNVSSYFKTLQLLLQKNHVPKDTYSKRKTEKHNWKTHKTEWIQQW